MPFFFSQKRGGIILQPIHNNIRGVRRRKNRGYEVDHAVPSHCNSVEGPTASLIFCFLFPNPLRASPIRESPARVIRQRSHPKKRQQLPLRKIHQNSVRQLQQYHWGPHKQLPSREDQDMQAGRGKEFRVLCTCVCVCVCVCARACVCVWGGLLALIKMTSLAT